MADFRDVLKAQQDASALASGAKSRLARSSGTQGGEDTMQKLAQSALTAARTVRLTELERRDRSPDETGDFTGQVVGTWVKVGEYGDGIVDYQGKRYTTVRLGKTSLFPGDKVQLSYAKGTYFSNW